jgi:hypothetical protein
MSDNQGSGEPSSQQDYGGQSSPDLSSILNSLGGAQDKSSSLDMGTIMLLQKAMGLFGQDDQNISLLRALQPHFSETRAKKVDDAIKILRIIRLLPLVSELGLFGNDKGGSSR